jgi:hypothetical protein
VRSRTRLPTSFALFGALMAGTRLRGDHTCRRVVPGPVGEEGVVIGGLRRAGALRRAGFRGHWESVAVSCDRDTDPSHISGAIRQAPTAASRHTPYQTDRVRGANADTRTGIGAPSRDGYRRAPLPGSRRAVGRVGASHAPPESPGDAHPRGAHHRRTEPFDRRKRRPAMRTSNARPNPIPPPQPPPRRPGNGADFPGIPGRCIGGGRRAGVFSPRSEPSAAAGG